MGVSQPTPSREKPNPNQPEPHLHAGEKLGVERALPLEAQRQGPHLLVHRRGLFLPLHAALGGPTRP